MAISFPGPIGINGKNYELSGGISRQRLQEWPESTPENAEQARINRRFLRSLAISGISGLLVERDYDGDLGACYDSTVETRWPGQITLGAKWHTVTAWNTAGVGTTQNLARKALVGPVVFDDKEFLLDQTLSGSTPTVLVRTFDETLDAEDWTTSPETIFASNTASVAPYRLQDLKRHGSYLFALFSGSEDTALHLYRRSIGSSSWSVLALGQIVDLCGSGWTAGLGAVTNPAGISGNCELITTAAGAGAGVLAYEDIAAIDLSPYTHIQFWARYECADATVTSVDIQLLLDNTAACVSPVETLTLPTITKGKWTFISIPLSDPSACAAIASVGVKQIAGSATNEALVYLDDIYGVTMPKEPLGDFSAKLCSIGTRLFLATQNSTTIHTTFSSDDGMTWNPQYTALTTAGGTEGGLNSFIGYIDDTGRWVPHLGNAEGVWRLDSEGKNAETVVDMRNNWHVDNCRAMAVWDRTGALYVSQGGSPRGRLIEHRIQSGVRYQRSIGLNLGSGLPALRRGDIVALEVVGDWLMAVNFYANNPATASLNSVGIFAFDTTGWHHIFDSNYSGTPASLWPTGALTNGPIPIGLGTHGNYLHLVVRKNYNGTTAAGLGFFVLFPLDDPLTRDISLAAAEQYQFEAKGYLDLSLFAGKLPELDTNWLQAHVDMDTYGASATDETIEMRYGLNGAARTAVDLGDFTTATKTLTFASGAGVSGKTIGVRLTFDNDGGDENYSPQLYAWTLDYIKVPSARHYYTLTIDIQKSASQGQRTVEEVYDEIDTIEASVTQVSLEIPGRSSVFVRPLEPSPGFKWELNEPQGSNPLRVYRGDGKVDLVLLELI